jgi:hypothetical protein
VAAGRRLNALKCDWIGDGAALHDVAEPRFLAF